tara:strand:- start:498 stop:704 length:207 start_codon:yes stop_codon:yes gene_type:complete
MKEIVKMSERQVFVNRIRTLIKDIELELKEGKFTKEVERYMLREAINSLKAAEKHLNGYLQVDKHNGN